MRSSLIFFFFPKTRKTWAACYKILLHPSSICSWSSGPCKADGGLGYVQFLTTSSQGQEHPQDGLQFQSVSENEKNTFLGGDPCTVANMAVVPSQWLCLATCEAWY